MRTISFTGYRRLEYEERVMDSIFGKDDHSGPIHGSQYRFLPCYDMGPPNNVGCDANTFRAIQAAFNAGSEFNLHLEDDTVISPDALDLCDWFFRHPERGNYVLLNLHAMSKGGAHPWMGYELPLDLVESARFNSWGWAITRDMWQRYILPEWNQKKHAHPLGWDWSMSLTIQRHGLKTLRPVLSRVLNIGRENGTYETPDHWDSWAKDLVASPGGFGKEFRIAERIGTMPPMEQWVHDELARATFGAAVHPDWSGNKCVR